MQRIVETTGNKDCHVVLQAGDAEALKSACASLEKLEKAPRCMLDCPDGPSAHKVASQVGSGLPDWTAIAGGTALFLIPVVIFTFLLRNHLLRGVTFGAIRK